MVMFGLMPYERNARGMMDLFNEMENSFFGDSGFNTTLRCRTDIQDMGDSYLLSAELPGFKKEDIKLDIEGDLLTISAEHSEEHSEDQKGGYLCRERHYGAYRRSFDVSSIQQDAIRASYQDGVLELTLPKKEAAPEPQRRAISIE